MEGPFKNTIKTMRFLYRYKRKLKLKPMGVAHLPLYDRNESGKFYENILMELNKGIKQFYVPRLMYYKNGYIPSKRFKLSITNALPKVKEGYPYLESKPVFRVVTNRNTVFDYGSLFKFVLNKDPGYVSHVKIRSNSEHFLLDTIFRFVSNSRLETRTFSKCDSLPPAILDNPKFDEVIVPIKIGFDDNKHYQYLINKYNDKTPLFMKKQPIIYEFGFLKFLILHYAGEINKETNPELYEYSKSLKGKKITFICYNKDRYFVINNETMESGDIDFKFFLSKLKIFLRIMIASNRNEEEIIDSDSEDTDEEDTLDTEDDSGITEETPKISTNLNDVSKDNNINFDNLSNIISDTLSTKKTSKKDLLLSFPGVAPIEEISQDELANSLKNDEENQEQDTDDGDYDEEVIELSEKIELKKEQKKTPQQLRRIKKVREKFDSLEFEGEKLTDILNDDKALDIEEEMAPIEMADESLKKSNMMDFRKSYTKKLMKRDMINTLAFFRDENLSIPIHILDISIEDSSNQLTRKQTWKIKLEDENQKQSTLTIDVPTFDEKGLLKINGSDKILNSQFSLLPVVKIHPDKVMLTSNYNKSFIYRQGKNINRSTNLIKKILTEIALNKDKYPKIKVQTGKSVKDNKDVLTTIEYDYLAEEFFRVSIPSINTTYYFNQKDLARHMKRKGMVYKATKDTLMVGIRGSKPITIDLHSIPGKNPRKSITNLILDDIRINNIIGASYDSISAKVKAPKSRMYSRIMYQNREIPLIAFLGSIFGLENVISTYGIDVEFSEKRIPKDNRLTVKFKDGFIYYDEYPVSKALLLNGLNYMDVHLYEYGDMESDDFYAEYFYSRFKTRNVIKGFLAAKELFIDPITKEILKDLKLPTEFLELFLYANTLLGDNKNNPPDAMVNYRIRNNEVIPVFLYQAMAKQYQLMKQHDNHRIKMTIPQTEIITKLNKSLNMDNFYFQSPVGEIKTFSTVSFKGDRGISNDRAITLKDRAYNKDALGITAISAVDSGKVGINKSLTINTKIQNTRGFVQPFDGKNYDDLKFGDIAAPTEALIPFINFHDDPRRTGLTSAQTKHVISTKGSTPPMVGTGYDKSVIYNVSDNYATKSKGPGKVVNIDHDTKLISVVYSDGSSEAIKFGNEYQKTDNIFLNNTKVPNVKIGQKIKKNDVIAYNPNYFQKNSLGDFTVKQGPVANVALIEGYYTEEDSALVSANLSKKMGTDVGDRKQIILTPQSKIINMLDIGDKVLTGDVLMSFESFSDDNQTSELLDSVGELSSDEWDDLMTHKVKSKSTGEIVDINIYWTVPLEELSESLSKVVEKYLKRIRKEIREEEKITGKKSDKRLLLEPTEPDKGRVRGVDVYEEGGVLIEFYVNHEHGLSNGDKIVAFSCIKSIVCEVVSQEKTPFTLKTGTKIDAVFSSFGQYRRMVMSTMMAGWLGKLLYDYGKKISDDYFK